VVVNVRNIAGIAAPDRRAKAAHVALQETESRRSQLVTIRRSAVRELRDAGWTWQAIATLLGIHRNRAAHLLDVRSVPEPNLKPGPKPL
jgi:hypothetical protein